LNPLSYRVIHLLLHAALAGGQECRLTDGASVKGLPDRRKLIQIIEKDWAKLKELLNCNDEDLGIALHITLDEIRKPPFESHLLTEKLRADWEKSVTEVVKKVFCNLPATLSTYRLGHACTTVSPLLTDIEEQAMEKSKEYLLKSHSSLFYITSPITLDDLKSVAHISSSPPLLHLLLHMEQRLSVVQHLPALIDFPLQVSARLRHKMTKAQAQKTSIGEFIKYDENMKVKYKRFKEAWNIVRGEVKRYECQEIEPPPMSEEVAISHCCIEPKDEGLFLCAIYEHLAALQNEFMDNVLKLAASGYPPLKILEHQEGISGVKYANLQDLTSLQVVKYDWNTCQRLLFYAEHNLKYGHGREITWDIKKIEAELAQIFVYGKVHISTKELDQFTFNSALPYTVGETLREIRTSIAQEELPVDSRKQIVDILNKDIEIIVPMFNVLLSFLKRTRGNPNTLLVNYCHDWSLDPSLLQLLRNNGVLKTLCLAHIVSLYESLEEALGKKIKKALDFRYATPLDQMQRQALQKLCKAVPPGDVSQAMHRCIVRHLGVEDAAHPSTPLKEYLLEADGALSTLWPVQPGNKTPCNPLDLIPDELLVSHIITAVDFVNSLLEERKATVILPKKPAAPRSKGRARFGMDQS